MNQRTTEPAGRIFISYRREETGYAAGWLYDRLTDRFGAGQVFKDVDSIELGDDFVEVVTDAVGSCDVLLALIGDRWSVMRDNKGGRRLDDPDDFVRLEIEAALSRNVRVIPILIDGAGMPTTDELPNSLAKLVRRQALELSPSRFEFDTNRLLKVLDSTLAEVRTIHGNSVQDVTPTMAATPSRTTVEPSRAAVPLQHRPISTGQPGLAAPGTAFEEIAHPPDIQLPGSSTRTRVLVAVGGGVGVVLVLLVAVIMPRLSTNSESTTSATQAPNSSAGTPAETFLVDTTLVQQILLQDSSFEVDGGVWRPVYKPDSVTFTEQSDQSVAKDGEKYGVVVVTEVQGSIGQDLRIAVQPGDHFAFTVHVRADPDQPVQGEVAIWLFSGDARDPQREPATKLSAPFIAGNDWKAVSFDLEATTTHTIVRAEVYVLTIDRPLYLDDTSLTRSR